MKKMNQFFAIGRAIVQLLEPLVEVVIHDTKTNKVIFIEGALSKRSIDDPSLLDTKIDTVEQEVYSKINFDGRLIKSISIPIKENDSVVALMCINYDTSVFQELNALTGILVNKQLTKKPDTLFKNDWQDRINEFISVELKEKGVRFADLTNKDKKTIVFSLFESGAFSEKNAADYIAKIMDMSRATIFNYLRSFREGNHAS